VDTALPDASHAKSALRRASAAAVPIAHATALVLSSPNGGVPLINGRSSCDRERQLLAGCTHLGMAPQSCRCRRERRLSMKGAERVQPAMTGHLH
jgi:hypothetical protein